MYHFCTYFDKNYLLRGVALQRSLARHCDAFRLHVLCMDDDAYDALGRLALDNLRPVRLSEVEAWDPRLLEAKGNRSRVEYYFTLSPHLSLFLLDLHPEIQLITYLDADMLFFASPQPLFDELGERSILLFEHRFPPHLEKNEIFGRYNVQFLSFRRDEQGLACLERWRDQCREWCYDRLEENRFADQKYLDEWPGRYDRAVVAQHPGGGVGPWNWSGSRFERDGEIMRVDGAPLIFYHFHALKVLTPRWISLGMARYGRMPGALAHFFYDRYLAALRESRDWLATQGVDVALTDTAHLRVGHSMLRTFVGALLLRQLMRVRRPD